MNQKLGYFDVRLFKKLVDEISGYPIAFLRMVGRGEPALHPKLRQIMEYLREKKFKVELCTNGILFEKYSYAEILSWNIDILDISVDGTDKESYTIIRKNGDYDNLRKNIAGFFAARNTSNKPSPKINIRNVIFPHYTKDQINAFKADWLGISDLICFNVLNPVNSSGLSLEKFIQCSEIFFSAHIRWDGRIAICPDQFIYGEERYIGDLRKDELQQIWRNPNLQELRLLHYKRDFSEIPECNYCFQGHNTYRNALIPTIIVPR